MYQRILHSALNSNYLLGSKWGLNFIQYNILLSVNANQKANIYQRSSQKKHPTKKTELTYTNYLLDKVKIGCLDFTFSRSIQSIFSEEITLWPLYYTETDLWGFEGTKNLQSILDLDGPNFLQYWLVAFALNDFSSF